MAIVFEPLAIAAGTSETNLVVLLSIDARSEAIAAGTSETDLVLLLSMDSELDQIADSEPEIPTAADFSIYLSMDGALATGITSETELTLILSMDGYLGNANDSFTEVVLNIGVEAYNDLSFSNYGFLVEQPAVVSGMGDMWAVRLTDSVLFGNRINLLPTAVMETLLAMGADPRTTYDGKNVLVDRLAFADPLHYVVVVLLDEGLVFGDQLTPTFTSFVRVVSRLLLSGSATHYAEAFIQILDGLVLRALADALNKAEITDTLVMGEHIASLYTLYAALLERLVLEGSATPEYLATVVVEERLLLGANLSHAADLAVLIRDSIGFATTLTIDNGEYIAWVLNTESKGLSRYTNYPFNSFAKIGGRYYGAGSDGIHRLEGEDDNGTDIKAMLRLGMTDMGSRKLKRLPEAFIGISTDGTILMKVITVSEDTGEKQAAIYKMRVRGAAVTRENRIQFGKGMKSVDWDWVIENVAGADFDLRSIEFRPVILDRRTRG